MTKFSCFAVMVGRKKKDEGNKDSSTAVDYERKLKTLQVRLEAPVKSCETNESKSTSFSVPVPFGIPRNARCKVKVTSHESPGKDEAMEEVAYEGEDEHEDNLSMKRDLSELDLQAHVSYSNDTFDADQFENATEKDAEFGLEMMHSGHVSDPGTRKAEFWASPKLKRSCSNLETRRVFGKIAEHPLSHSHSFEELQRLAERWEEKVHPANPGSPTSVMTRCSADKVILKKHSSSQILPSRSRKLWWKLFLWSHRNMSVLWTDKAQVPKKPIFNQQGGYSSDTLEPKRALELDKVESPRSFAGESLNMGNNDVNQSWDSFHGRASGLWPQNQWVAFSAESPLSRVDEWVKELSNQPPLPENDDHKADSGVAYPPSLETGRSPARSTSHMTQDLGRNIPEEILCANRVIQSLNSSSTVAHIAGIGLKVIPTLARFSSLRSVNLSANSIVHVSTGSLPKGLHTLNLSRNKICTIEGFRELTRLRVLDLSYNRITRIGHGLSNCTLIKELYLAGNKIGEIEGLHRLLKLTVLDLSFNKITTTKALGQLVANYNSLLALNLLGNPVQSNISDDQLRKTVCSLLPSLAYLNKQPINTQKAREMTKENVAKAALGNDSWSTRRRTAKRVSHGRQLSSGGHRSNAIVAQKGRHRSTSRTSHHSVLKMEPSMRASSSR